MLRARLGQCSRAVVLPNWGQAATLHTSAVLQASVLRKRRSRVAEKANIDKRQERERLAQSSRPHIVLGNRPGDEAKWQNCDLAKAIITEEDILAAPMLPASLANGEVLQKPSYYNYGVGGKEEELLFGVLPNLTLEGANEVYLRSRTLNDTRRFNLANMYAQADINEAQKTAMLARIVDLRNANARGIAYENRKRIIAEFSEPGNLNDTGRPEVQAALLTLRIRNVWDHMSRFKKDISNRRSLRRLVHQRARILRYLKGVDRDRYDRVLDRLGLEPESVEGELVV